MALMAQVAFYGPQHEERLGMSEEELLLFNAKAVQANQTFLTVWISLGTQASKMSLAKSFYWKRHGTVSSRLLEAC